MKRIRGNICIVLLCAILISGCANSADTVISSEASQMIKVPVESSSQPGESMEEDTQRLPVFDGGGYQPQDPEESLPPQIILDEPICYKLAEEIMKTTCFVTNWHEGFEKIEDANQVSLLLIALFRTPQIMLPYSYTSETGVTSTEYPNHQLIKLMRHEEEEGRFLEELFYQDDVEKTMRYLFGDNMKPNHFDILPYYYYKKEGVYGINGSYGGPMWKYPQITSYTKTQDGYVVEAITIFALDKEIPLEENGVPLTKANFKKATQKNEWIRYTYKTADDGRLTLNGIKILREKTIG